MRTHISDRFELTVEVRNGRETALIADLGYIEIVLQKQLLSMAYSDFIDKPGKCLVGPGLKIAAKRGGGHIQHGGNFFQR